MAPIIFVAPIKMENGDLSPLTVAPFSRDFLIDLVRYKTGSDQRSLVSGKAQLNYLCSYLEEDHVGAKIGVKTIVVEDQYIDRHFIEDYSEYYARCFSSYSKNCCRAHFFSFSFTDSEFRSALRKGCPDFLERLKESYLGYVVIRPIPHTFFARVCIKPYHALISQPGYKVIKKEHSASLFGLPLSVETTAFLEQDKVVSACATSALWTLLSASSDASSGALPSPSAITKSAFYMHHEGLRTFPTSGLTQEQVTRSLKHFGLEPTTLRLSSDNALDQVKETVFAYISNDIPVLIGGDVFRVANDGGEPEHLGKHFVCALGFHVEDVAPGVDLAITNRAHAIDKIYVHDDRYGPFVRLDAKLKTEKEGALRKFIRQHFRPVVEAVEEIAEKKTVSKSDRIVKAGLIFSLKDEIKEAFVPDCLIVGHYHKIRIPYSHIWDICDALHSCLYFSYLAVHEAKAADDDARTYNAELAQALDGLVSGVWEVSLTTSTHLKSEALTDGKICTFNGANDRLTLLMQSMPKYIWRCRISHGASRCTDILFDATEIPQGPLMVGYLTYSPLYEQMWQYISSSINKRVWEDYPDRHRERVSCVLSFFLRFANAAYLNTLYGPLRLPNRELKAGEKDHHDNITRQDAFIVRRGHTGWLNLRLNQQKKYIWVVDELGDLVIGEDISTDTGFQGHPTLIDGRPARLGGELFFAPPENAWVVNLKSRTYSSHLDPSSDEAKGYLQSVIENNFAGGSVVAG